MTHAKKTPAPDQVAIRHPGPWPMAFGAYATGITYLVDPATAARLLARGFERVSDAEPSAAADATYQPAGAVASAAQAMTLFPADPASED